MNIEILQERLAPMLTSAVRLTAPKSTTPVISNVLLTAKEGRLYISATDLLMAITLNASCKVHQEGSITLPGKLLTDFVGELPKVPVTIDVNYSDMSATVRAGSSEINIKGIEADEFPVLPVITTDAIVALDGSVIKSAVAHTAFAVSTNDAFPMLKGVLLKLSDAVAFFAAADGVRLATYESELVEAVKGVHRLIIPARAMEEVARTVSDESVVEIIVTESGGQVLFHTDSVDLIARLIDGKYPDVESAIPASYDTRVIADSDPFRKMVKMAAPFAESNTRIYIDLNPGASDDHSGELVVRSHSGEIGKYNGSLNSSVYGPKGSVLVNSLFLSQAFSALKAPKIAIEMRESSKPIVITEVGVPEWKYIVYTLGYK